MVSITRPIMFLRALLLFGLLLQHVYTLHTRSFCTGIMMPETRLCDDNRPIIEIVEVSQYDFTGDEYPGRPCVYSDSDCERAIRHDTQLYKDILTHCVGQRTCGGFHIMSIIICSRGFGDYMTIRFRCRRDETDVTPTTSPTSPSTSPQITNTSQQQSVTSPSTSPQTTSTKFVDTSSVTDVGVAASAAVVVAGVVGVVVAIIVVCVRRQGEGTETGIPNDGVAYYNVAHTVIHGEGAYSNVDINSAPGSEAYSNVDITRAPGSQTYSNVDINREPGSPAYSNVAITPRAPGSQTYSNVDINREPGSPAYSNVDITTRAPESQAYSNVDINREPGRQAYSDVDITE